jgi:hypothetical protein
VDERYRSVIWIGSAVDREDMEKPPEANPFNFALYLKPPKLLLQGDRTRDRLFYFARKNACFSNGIAASFNIKNFISPREPVWRLIWKQQFNSP